jgi:mannose-1-phosphate guanylyltransferase
VGTWGSVYQLSEKDKNENAVVAEACYTYSTERTFISLPKGKIAVVNGLSDYIVVDTPDALLICPRSEEQSIKNFIDDVHFANGEKFI